MKLKKTRSVACAVRRQLLSKALPDPALMEYTQVIIEQADRLRNLVDRLLGPQHPGMHITESIHKVAGVWWRWSPWSCRITSN